MRSATPRDILLASFARIPQQRLMIPPGLSARDYARQPASAEPPVGVSSLDLGRLHPQAAPLWGAHA